MADEKLEMQVEEVAGVPDGASAADAPDAASAGAPDGEAPADAADAAADAPDAAIAAKPDRSLVAGLVALAVAVIVIAASIASTVATLSEDAQQDADDASPSAAQTPAPDAHAPQAGSSSASPAAPEPAYRAAKYHDSRGNPSLYSMTVLDGADLLDLLDQYRFQWDEAVSSWTLPDGTLFAIRSAEGPLDQARVAALPAGSADQPLFFSLTTKGYATPADAFSGLVSELSVIDELDGGETFVAVVGNPAEVSYLVAIAPTGDDEQTILVFTPESVASGLLSSVVGMDVGSTLDAAWRTFSGGYRIGERNAG